MIREGVVGRLKELLAVEDIPVNVPPKQEVGDFSSAICLSLAKQRKRPPMEIAREVAASFGSNVLAGLPRTAGSPSRVVISTLKAGSSASVGKPEGALGPNELYPVSTR